MTHTSREYAEALFELAAEEGREAEYAEALKTVRQALEQEKGFLSLLASPAISRNERMDVVSTVLKGKVPEKMLALLRMMVFRGRSRDIPRMIDAFYDLAREARHESEARVVSAVALTDKEKDALREKLEKRFGRRIVLNCQVDPAVLGGIRVETEGRVLDGTLRSRLQEIKEVMNT